jgi:hypothetical protein
VAHDEDLAQEWAKLLFGAPIAITESVTRQLVHRLSRPAYELSQWRLSVGAPSWLSWKVHLVSPLHEDSTTSNHLWRDSKRVLLSPDACWPHVANMEAAHTCLAQGVALAWFDRLDFAHDPPSAERQGTFYEQFPDISSGCLSIWAWGLSLTAQALREQIPDSKIGVIGHSRGGKAALLCAALDQSIDAVIANNSGVGGAASLTAQGDGAECLQQLIEAYPHWFSKQAVEASAQSRITEIDCQPLWSRISPRPLLILQAEDDLWANPLGTRKTFISLTEQWKSSSASEALALIERKGGHEMQTADWQQAAKFMRHAKYQ